MRTVVAFKSETFNSTEPKEYFINECCFGDDLGKWLIGELKSRGVDVDPEPDQEDWGWYVTCRADGTEHTIGIGFRPDDTEGVAGEWLCFIERRVGILQRLRGVRKEDVAEKLPSAVHDVLSNTAYIRDIRWHVKTDFDALNEERWAEEPNKRFPADAETRRG
jgi:hypothetical protein